MRLDKNVKCSLKENQVVRIDGKFGIISKKYGGKDIQFKGEKMFIGTKSSYETFKKLIIQQVKGVTQGYFLKIQLKGLGYRVLNFEKRLLFKLGFGHYISFNKPDGLFFLGFKDKLLIFGVDLEKLGQVGRIIMNFKKVDAYKGKGIILRDSEVKVKVGKQR